MAKARVFIDGYYLGKTSGYGRFIQELCHSLGAVTHEFSFIVAVRDTIAEALLKPYPNFEYLRLPNATFPVWEQFIIPFFASLNSYDLVHFPYNTSAVMVRGAKKVVTVHDLTFLVKGADRNWKSQLIHAYYAGVFGLSSARCANVISVSDTTKNALLGEKVHSKRIYNTVDGFLEANETLSPRQGNRPYILHRGSPASNHRNTDRIIDAFLSRAFLRDNFTLKIFGVPEGAHIRDQSLDQPVEFLPRMSDAELASLYAHSACILAPSLLEGFCLPIIEAFGFGAPVITSDIDPMREIAGDAAVLVSPYCAEAIADAMVSVLSDPELSAELVRKGRRRLGDFGKAKIAGDLIDTYRDALGLA